MRQEEKIFDINEEFEKYLKESKLVISSSSTQYNEMKKAFVAGIFRIFFFILLRLPKEDVLSILDEIRKDGEEFWKNQLKK